jgi:hypothetical protein
MEVSESVTIVKRAVRALAIHLAWSQPGILQKLNEQEEARKAMAALPSLEIASSPYYASVDEGQSGFVLSAHLTDDQMVAVPPHIVREMLDELAGNAGGVHPDSPLDSKRRQLLSAYGPELAELVCQGIDEALASREEGHKRLRDYDGKLAPLSSSDLDEPCYEDCAADAEHACPTTTFDFWDVIEAAGALIEERDKAAASARRGELPSANPLQSTTLERTA